MDRIRASNTYGEPIVNFNEDSVTKKELKESVDQMLAPVLKKIKVVQKSQGDAEPVMDDMRDDIAMIKSILKKQKEKVEKISSEDLA